MWILRTQRSIQQRLPPKRTAQQPPAHRTLSREMRRNSRGQGGETSIELPHQRVRLPNGKLAFDASLSSSFVGRIWLAPARSLTALSRPTREASRCADAIYAGPTSSSHSNTTAAPSIRTQASFTLIQAEDRLWRRQGFTLPPSQKTRFSTEANCLTLQQ